MGSLCGGRSHRITSNEGTDSSRSTCLCCDMELSLEFTAPGRISDIASNSERSGLGSSRRRFVILATMR